MPDATRTTHVEGLAVHELGSGPPLLLVPNPQGMVGASESEGALPRVLVDLGRHVITFDPPGAFGSADLTPRLGLAEMADCSMRALAATGVDEPIAVVGHSQGTLAALSLALAHPGVVERLVLVGPVDGGLAATKRARGIPFGWSRRDPDFWRFAWLGAKLSVGRGSAADYKRLRALIVGRSFHDRALAPRIEIGRADTHLPPPRRAGWQRAVRDVDLLPRMGAIGAPALVCVGRFDRRRPSEVPKEEIVRAMPSARLEIFERSGHYPFVEEPGAFREIVGRFLAGG